MSFESRQDQDRVEREARVRDPMAVRGQPSSLAHCMDLCTQGPIDLWPRRQRFPGQGGQC